jgi:hypothetical protein
MRFRIRDRTAGVERLPDWRKLDEHAEGLDLSPLVLKER